MEQIHVCSAVTVLFISNRSTVTSCTAKDSGRLSVRSNDHDIKQAEIVPRKEFGLFVLWIKPAQPPASETISTIIIMYYKQDFYISLRNV